VTGHNGVFVRKAGLTSIAVLMHPPPLAVSWRPAVGWPSPGSFGELLLPRSSAVGGVEADVAFYLTGRM
jgi:hypothetical protein